MAYQLSPTTVMGEQLKPIGTVRPVRSRPRAAALVDDTVLWQH
jgi:hypothetical protein